MSISRNLAQLADSVATSGILNTAGGGTGTATPDIVAGTNVTVSGTWPNQTINSTVLPLIIAVSDEITALSTGTAKVTFRAPFALTLTAIPRASISTASSVNSITADIKVGGTSILGTTKLSINATQKTSTTATATSLITTSIADDAEITVDILSAGTSALGLKVTLYYVRT